MKGPQTKKSNKEALGSTKRNADVMAMPFSKCKKIKVAEFQLDSSMSKMYLE